MLEFAGAAEDMLARLAAVVQLEITPAPSPPPADALAIGGNSLFQLAGERDFDPMLLASAVFGAVSVLQTLRGKVMIPALSAFRYAANAFQLARQYRAMRGHE